MRSPRVLWILTAVLVMALPLLVLLQIRWARQLEQADVEQLRTRTTEQLNAAREELQIELMRWVQSMQGLVDVGPPLVNPRATWRVAPHLGDMIRGVYLVLAPGSETDEAWYHLPVSGDPVPLDRPAVTMEDELLGPMQFSLLPRPYDDRYLALRVLRFVGDLVPMLEKRMTSLDMSDNPNLVVLLDRAAIEAWVADVMARHLGRSVASLDYGVAASGSGFDDVWILGTPTELEPEATLLHRVEVALESLHALGHTLVAPDASDCGADETCASEGDARAEAEADDGRDPPRFFLSLPDKGEAWRLEVRNHRHAMDPRLRALWRRNLAIGLAALAVLAVGVGLLIALTVQYQRLARAQFDFVTGVTHELQTPLSVLGASAANLADGLVVDDPHARRYGAVQRKEVKRLRELVDRVLGFTRAQIDPTEPARVAVAERVERVVGRLALEAAERGVEVETAIADDLPEIAVHPWLLDSLLQNLLSNALKYGGDRVRIEATAGLRRRRTIVTLTVRDWGPGLSRTERRRIFRPFFRGRDARAEQAPGVGLGLSWVARLVQRAGGRMVVDSKVGAGSRFGVELPVAEGGA